MTETLKPCPFCGGVTNSMDSFRNGPETQLYYVSCDADDCGVEGPGGYSEAEALTLWNTRKETP